MLIAYRPAPRGLVALGPGGPLSEALWVDLYRPEPDEVAALTALGIEVPTLEDMEEIEISNRLYREAGADVMTVVLPGDADEVGRVASPVSFILTDARLVTVRHHRPRPFETFPERADRSAAGCGGAERLFLGLVEEIVARQADLLEGVGRVLDRVSGTVLVREGRSPAQLRVALAEAAGQGELLGHIRLALLTLERALSFFDQTLGARSQGKDLRRIVSGQTADIQALVVHADYLSARIGLSVDATLGMINLAQNETVRILSVAAVLFLPPMVIGSIYGMNFRVMPELDHPLGYPAALVVMVVSALVTYLVFKWKNWL